MGKVESKIQNDELEDKTEEKVSVYDQISNAIYIPKSPNTKALDSGLMVCELSYSDKMILSDLSYHYTNSLSTGKKIISPRWFALSKGIVSYGKDNELYNPFSFNDFTKLERIEKSLADNLSEAYYEILKLTHPENVQEDDDDDGDSDTKKN